MKKERTARVKIVNVKYKQVVRPKQFDHNDVYSKGKKAFDSLMDCVHKKPTGYFMCAFGDKRSEIFRAWHIGNNQDCISYSDLPNVLYNIALRG